MYFPYPDETIFKDPCLFENSFLPLWLDTLSRAEGEELGGGTCTSHIRMRRYSKTPLGEGTHPAHPTGYNNSHLSNTLKRMALIFVSP